MNENKQKELVTGLIKNGLINSKLVNGLKSFGLDANNYSIYIGDAIFALMNFKNDGVDNQIFENVYFAITEKVKYIDFSVSVEELERISEEIYTELLFAKEICDIKPQNKQ